jgi:hypothetical protein
MTLKREFDQTDSGQIELNLSDILPCSKKSYFYTLNISCLKQFSQQWLRGYFQVGKYCNGNINVKLSDLICTDVRQTNTE